MELFLKIFFKFKDEIFNITLFNIDSILYYLYIIPAVIFFEFMFVGWEKSSIKKIIRLNKTVKTDAIIFFLQVFGLFNLLGVIFSFGIFHILFAAIYKFTNFNLIHTIDNIYLQTFVLIVIIDFIKYITHASFHKSQTLWIIHAFHHSATEFCILNRFRDHFLEGAIKKLFYVLPFAILGSIESFLIIGVLTEFHKLIIHSAFRSNWGLFGRYIIVSPAAHRIHHSIKPEHYGKNYSTTFIIWDRLFGTYYEGEETNDFGVAESNFNQNGLINDFIMVIKDFILALKSNFKKTLNQS